MRWVDLHEALCVDCDEPLRDPVEHGHRYFDNRYNVRVRDKWHIQCEPCGSHNLVLLRQHPPSPNAYTVYGRCPVFGCGVKSLNPMCNDHWMQLELSDRQKYWTIRDQSTRERFLVKLARM